MQDNIKIDLFSAVCPTKLTKLKLPLAKFLRAADFLKFFKNNTKKFILRIEEDFLNLLHYDNIVNRFVRMINRRML